MTPGLAFATAFLLTFILTPLTAWLGRRLGWVDRPGGRRSHRGTISRLGGVALFAGFIGTGLLIFTTSPWPPVDISRDRHLLSGVIVGAVFVFLFGLLDDALDLPAWPQFIAQFLAALIAIGYTIFIQQVTLPFFGFKEFDPWLTYPLTIFWVMGMLNTVNWLDGLDGLAAGVTAIAGLLFAFHAHRLGQGMVALFPLALAGACLGFLPFNFHPARVFMGTAGSMTLGWALASLSILAPAKVATALLVLGIPIIDVAWLILRRWRHGHPPTQGGRDHLHFRLLDLGLSQRQIVLLYYSFCLSFGLLALIISSRVFKLVALLVLGGMTVALLGWLSREEAAED
ncbi:MAG: glycosyltransferase family 4 protein [Anaerolineae bacterium]